MNLHILLPIIIFFILFLAQILISIVMFLIFVVSTGTSTNFRFIIPPIPILLSVSLVTGLLLTVLLNQMILKPMATLVSAINELAKGNFHVKIHMGNIKELSNVSDSFNRMSEELANTEILRTDFINNFSHEFKTPLVSLKGFAKLLKNPDLSQEKRSEYLDIIIHEADRLSTLSKNILNLSKVEKLCIISEKKCFNLAEQIRRCTLLLEPKWAKKKLNLNIDLEEITYLGNEDLLSQVWVNLLDNAIKFSPEGADISISLLHLDRQIIFSIQDQGCGIPEESISHIFDKFYQGDTSHMTDGNGIGLAVVKRIIDLCNGYIQVKSQPGLGTAVSLFLPEVSAPKP
ncbi:HAMP domain-containing sensor histidine kinase [Lachnospiraceae bacterium 62-35]